MRVGLLVLVVLLTAGGCATPEGERTLTVFAASSLGLAFEEMGESFQESDPGVEVVLSLAGSQTLATQISQGARPDVFASADEEQMARATSAVEADVGPIAFATNRLTIVVREGNPRGISGLDDLARDDLVVVLGADEVPVGRYARRALARAGVEVEAASREPNVGLVLTRVRMGEADAGIVYESDLTRAGEGVEGVAIAAEFNQEATYPIAAWGGDLARDFVDFVTSSSGREILVESGFQP